MSYGKSNLVVEELPLKRPRSQMSINQSGKSNDIRRRRLGIVGKVLSIVGRKTLNNGHDMDHNEDSKDSLLSEAVSGRSRFNLINDLDRDGILEADPEFELLQSRTAAIIERKRKVRHVKELESRQQNLREQLKQLELKEMHIKGKQLKGQLKELQIKELKIKEGQLRELQKHELEFNDPNVTILDHSDETNSSSVHPGDISSESLPEPLIGLNNDSIIKGVNELSETLHTAMLDPMMMNNSLIRTLSRILETAQIVANVGAGTQSKQNNSSKTASLLPLLRREMWMTPETKTSEKFEAYTPLSGNSGMENNYNSLHEFKNDEKVRKKQHRLMPLNPSQLELQKQALLQLLQKLLLLQQQQQQQNINFLKIKIYVPSRDTVFALKIDKLKLGLIAFLVQTVQAKTSDILNLKTPPQFLLVTRNSGGSLVPLTNEQGLSTAILEYVRSKDKIHVLVE